MTTREDEQMNSLSTIGLLAGYAASAILLAGCGAGVGGNAGPQLVGHQRPCR